jgi:hypothetical protein
LEQVDYAPWCRSNALEIASDLLYCIDREEPRVFRIHARVQRRKESPMNRLLVCLAGLTALTVLPACASQPISPEAMAGTYTATMTDEALAGAGAPFSTRIEYKGREWIMEFTPDGIHRWSEVTPIGVVERSYGEFSLTTREILFKKDYGEESCSQRGYRGRDFTEEGRYKWKLQGDQLTFELISDECEGRSYNLIAVPWVRQP